MCSRCMRIPVKTACTQSIQYPVGNDETSSDAGSGETFNKLRKNSDEFSEAVTIQQEEVHHAESR